MRRRRGKTKKTDCFSFNGLSNNFCPLSKIVIISGSSYLCRKTFLLYCGLIKDEVSAGVVIFKLDVAESFGDVQRISEVQGTSGLV